MQKSQKKKKKKKFYATFLLAVFLFPVIKRAEKVSEIVFFVRGEGKCEINNKKKSNFKKKMLSTFFRHYGLEKTECVRVGVCVRVITAQNR